MQMKADQAMTGFLRRASIGLAVSLVASTAFAAPSDTIAAFPFGRVITPGSSQPTTGQFAHTNYQILLPSGQDMQATDHPSGIFETPASLACIYKQVRPTPGCNPKTLTAVAHGGSRVIVIVDAFHYQTARNDLSVFSKHFGLPDITSRSFQVIYAYGVKPPVDPSGEWELEEALDIEMAHSLAPNAKIVLVEANSNSYNDLNAAEVVASGVAEQYGGGEVSNSWGGPEFPNELAFGSNFIGTNVVFFASAGDAPGVLYPSVLPNVVGVGGTQIDREASGDFVDQAIWFASGGGFSQYVPLPSFQATIAAKVKNVRGVPDVASEASVASGVWVYDTTPYASQIVDWIVVGGTSVASPSIAAMVNSAGNFAASSAIELDRIYANYGNPFNFTDIKLGECGNDGSHLQGYAGWDPCTGVGVPRGRKGL
jgi:subtilase family serine protease